MNTSQNQYFANWAKRKRVKSNLTHREISFWTAVQDLHTSFPFGEENESFTVYKNHVNPVLFLRYVGNWERCRHLSLSNWKELNKEWLETCWKQKWYNQGELSLFKTIDEVKAALSAHFGENQIAETSYVEAAQALRTIAELKLEKEQKELAKRKETTMNELEKALMSGNPKEIQKQSQEVRRIVKEEEAQEFRNLTNAINNGDSLPTSKPVFTMPEPKQTTMKDVFEASSVDTSTFFEEFVDDSFLKSQIPTLKKNQILLYKDTLKAHSEFKPEFPYLKVKSVYSTGKKYITFGEVPGIAYSLNSENQIVINNQDLVTAFFEMFEAKHWLLLTISDNVSANEELQAYEILNVEKK